MFKRLLRPSAFKVALVIGLAFSAMQLMRHLGTVRLQYLDLLEAKAIDWKFALRGPLPLSHRVALAEVDERAVQSHGLWPWNRGLVAKAIDKLFDAGAQVVALDISMTDPDRNSAFQTLTEVRTKLGPVPAELSPSVEAAVEKVVGPARGELQKALEIAARQRVALAEGAQVLDAAVAHAPDLAMRECIERHKDDLVLGSIGVDGESRQKFDAKALADWDSEVRASVIPTAFHIGTVGGQPSIQPAPVQRWRVSGDASIEGWLPEIAGANRWFGLFSLEPDTDGTLRNYQPVRSLGTGFFPSLAAAAVARTSHSQIYPARLQDGLIDGVGLWTDTPGVNGGQTLVQAPVDGYDNGKMLVNYLGPNRTWRSSREMGPDGKPACAGASCNRVSLADVLDGSFDPAVVKDKIVFLSVTAIGTFDQRVTPFDIFGAGVFVHMNVAEDFISQRFIDNSTWLVFVEVAMLLGVALLYGLVLPRMHLVGQLAMLPLGLGGSFGASVFLFNRGTQLTTVTPLLEIAVLTFSIVFFEYATTDKEKRQVRQAFQYYLTESVMTEMLKDPSKLKLGGEKKNLTVLFSDIRGFTTLSEMLEPSEVVRRLNEYLTPMTNLVFKTGGTVDKYMGDAIMAFWGAPVDQPDHALRACQTACEMLLQLDELRARWKTSGQADIDIGIGLNSGNIHVGNMGSDSRFDYTVIGDDVNLASRLEGTNKSYGTRIIIGENTFQQVKGRVVSRELGGVMVKGKKKPVTIYELRRVGEPNAEELAIIAAFERGLISYRARDWDASEAAFHEVQRAWAHDGPSEKYLEDIAEKRAHPPDAGWDGVYVMKTK